MFKKILAVLLLLSIPNNTGYMEVKVDMIEVNTVYDDEDGFVKFTQLIFWNWNYKDNRWQVVDFIMWDNRIWDQNDEEHKKKFLKDLMNYCVKYKLSFNELKNRYNGRYNPIPGVNFPEKNHKDGYYYINCNKHDKMFRIRTKIFRETFTFNDPEIDNRKIYKERSGLIDLEPIEGTLR